MRQAPRIPGCRIAVIAWIAGAIACAPASDLSPRRDLDRAVAQFVAGDYRSAIEHLEVVLAAGGNDVERGEAYTYLGRAHMALGETDEAITAFTLGARSGAGDVCVEYLETLKQYVEGAPGSLHMNEVVTRSQLAGAVLRMMDPGGARTAGDPTGPTPLERLEAKGWMAPMADGQSHADDPVTAAALFIVVTRLLEDAHAADRAGETMPGGYRAAAMKERFVSGGEALAVLERVRALRESHGR